MAEKDLDLDEDLQDDIAEEDDDIDGKSGIEEHTAKPGEQDDGSYVLEEDDAKGATNKEENADADDNHEDDDAEAKREARRKERKERRQRQRDREEQSRRELAAEREARRMLEDRLAAIERRNASGELAQLDNAITQTQQAYNHFKEQIRLGQEQSNGQMVAEATEKMMLAGQRMQQLGNIKSAYQQRQSAPPPLDERVRSNVQRFQSRHTWYRADSSDSDSAILRTLDNAVAAEGYNPATEAYWKELENRIKKYLPHRIKSGKVTTTGDDEITEPKPRSVVTGSGRENQTGKKGVYKLSAERVKALKEAGVWEDPEKRSDAIKRYREYDKANQGR